MFLWIQLLEGSGSASLFLYEARQTGKSTLLQMLFPAVLYFDILQSDVFERYQKNSTQYREVHQGLIG